MVLEGLISPIKAETHPMIVFFHGFLYASVALFLSLWVFPDHTSLIMVFLTTMAAMPLIYSIIKIEEKKDLSLLPEKNILKEHSKALRVFLNYFIGATLAYALWYTIIANPTETFKVQTDTLIGLRGHVTGNAYSLGKVFWDILSNNLKVLIFCVLFSFIYGLGSLFILTWNASVIGVAIGDTIRSGIMELGKEFSFASGGQYVSIITYGLFRYYLHGIVEIGAYFVAGLAGGIISVAVIRHDFGTKKYEKILMDSSMLILLSLVLVVLAAVLEVYVTPLLF
jgi:uncharacterized membrane protein SpoIIM required for sporulation